MLWFTADTHFGHKRIVELAHRPFSSIEEHDAEIIRRWNAQVLPTDTVYHLGDFAFTSDWNRYAARLNGSIHIIWGNHDHSKQRAKHSSLFASNHELLRIKLSHKSIAREITMCHYPMRVWNKSHHGMWHLFGHEHGALNKIQDQLGFSFDVGVDSWDYAPVSLDRVAEKMNEIALRRATGKVTGGEHHDKFVNENMPDRCVVCAFGSRPCRECAARTEA